MRKRAKKDTNHNEIVRALADVGYLVAETHQIGAGFPDAVCAGVDRRTGMRRVWLLEIKHGRGRLTPDERTFHAQWGEHVNVVHSIDEAYRLVGVLE